MSVDFGCHQSLVQLIINYMLLQSSLTMENFNKLTKENKQKVINLLPVIDRCDE